ncbi:MAG: MBL fold metallo-hydrolase [bacterium]
MIKYKSLIRDIDRCRVRHGHLAFWWLGQHSFVVKTCEAVMYLDPFLALHPKRRVPPLLKPGKVTHADFIFGSHDHADHIDREVWPAMAAASPRASFVVPEILRGKVSRELGIPSRRFIGIDDGQSKRRSGVKITGIASAHELLDPDPQTGQFACLGFVIESGGCTIYHSGDCCIYEGLQTKLQRWQFDVVFLPINGRDAKRLASDCIGNMTYQEAADLAGALRPGLTVPAHFDMFKGNLEDPSLFADYMRVKYPRLNVCVPDYGVRVSL